MIISLIALQKKKKKKRALHAGQIDGILLKGFTAHHGGDTYTRTCSTLEASRPVIPIPTSGLYHIIAFKCGLGIVSVASRRQGLIGRSCYPFLHFCCTTLKLLHYLFDCRNHFCILLATYMNSIPNYYINSKRIRVESSMIFQS